MLWTPINYWPAMRLAFEIVLAIPALLLVAALWTGARQRRRLRAVSESRSIGETAIPIPPSPTHRYTDTPAQSKLSESDFAAALIHVERLRARGDHAAADAMLASLHGLGPPALTQ
jgi:hypothetical protein